MASSRESAEVAKRKNRYSKTHKNIPKTAENSGDGLKGKIISVETEQAPAIHSDGSTALLKTISLAPVMCRSLPTESATFIVSVIYMHAI